MYLKINIILLNIYIYRNHYYLFEYKYIYMNIYMKINQMYLKINIINLNVLVI